jgi:hypothetical protein
MARLVLILSVLVLLAGCGHLTYVKPNMTTEEWKADMTSCESSKKRAGQVLTVIAPFTLGLLYIPGIPMWVSGAEDEKKCMREKGYSQEQTS